MYYITNFSCMLRNFFVLLIGGGIVGYLVSVMGFFAAERSSEFIGFFTTGVLLGGGIFYLLQKHK